MKRTFVDKFSKVIVHTSARKSGYVASSYLRNGKYCGCLHVPSNQLDSFLNGVLSDYKEIK